VAGRVRGFLERLLGRRLDAAAVDGVADSELLRRFVTSRDEAAFELLVWRHGMMVLGLCRRAVRDEQLAEDAFQAVFLVLARKAGAIRGGNVGGWLFRVARRVAARASRTRLSVRPAPELPAEPQSSPAECQELAEILDSEVARLPERLRRAVILCYLGGRSTDHAARELGCPRGTVLSRLAAARKRLADRLTRRGVTLPAVLPVLGATLRGELVSATVAGVPRFLSGGARAGNAAILAEGVIRTMTRIKLVTVFGIVFLVTGLASGVGWVAAQTESKTAGAGAAQPLPQQPPPERAPAAQGAPAGSPAPAASDGEDPKQPDQLKKLEVMHAELATELSHVEKELEKIREQVARESRDMHTRIRELQSEYDLDRELALADLRDSANQVRAARRQLGEIELTGGAPPVDLVKKKLELAVKELDQRKGELKQLDMRYSPQLEEARGKHAAMEANAAGVIRKLEAERAIALELLARLRSQIHAVKFQQAGVPPVAAAGVEAKLDLLIRELGELRKDVRELKKPQ